MTGIVSSVSTVALPATTSQQPTTNFCDLAQRLVDRFADDPSLVEELVGRVRALAWREHGKVPEKLGEVWRRVHDVHPSFEELEDFFWLQPSDEIEIRLSEGDVLDLSCRSKTWLDWPCSAEDDDQAVQALLASVERAAALQQLSPVSARVICSSLHAREGLSEDSRAAVRKLLIELPRLPEDRSALDQAWEDYVLFRQDPHAFLKEALGWSEEEVEKGLAAIFTEREDARKAAVAALRFAMQQHLQPAIQNSFLQEQLKARNESWLPYIDAWLESVEKQTLARAEGDGNRVHGTHAEFLRMWISHRDKHSTVLSKKFQSASKRRYQWARMLNEHGLDLLDRERLIAAANASTAVGLSYTFWHTLVNIFGHELGLGTRLSFKDGNSTSTTGSFQIYMQGILAHRLQTYVQRLQQAGESTKIFGDVEAIIEAYRRSAQYSSSRCSRAIQRRAVENLASGGLEFFPVGWSKHATMMVVHTYPLADGTLAGYVAYVNRGQRRKGAVPGVTLYRMEDASRTVELLMDTVNERGLRWMTRTDSLSKEKGIKFFEGDDTDPESLYSQYGLKKMGVARRQSQKLGNCSYVSGLGGLPAASALLSLAETGKPIESFDAFERVLDGETREMKTFKLDNRIERFAELLELQRSQKALHEVCLEDAEHFNFSARALCKLVWKTARYVGEKAAAFKQRVDALVAEHFESYTYTLCPELCVEARGRKAERLLTQMSPGCFMLRTVSNKMKVSYSERADDGSTRVLHATLKPLGKNAGYRLSSTGSTVKTIEDLRRELSCLYPVLPDSRPRGV